MIDTLTNDVPQHCRLQDILTPANHGNHGDTYVRRLSHSHNAQQKTLQPQSSLFPSDDDSLFFFNTHNGNEASAHDITLEL